MEALFAFFSKFLYPILGTALEFRVIFVLPSAGDIL
jgi:hypothetical protein